MIRNTVVQVNILVKDEYDKLYSVLVKDEYDKLYSDYS